MSLLDMSLVNHLWKKINLQKTMIPVYGKPVDLIVKQKLTQSLHKKEKISIMDKYSQ